MAGCGQRCCRLMVGLRVVVTGKDGSRCQRKPICGSVVVSLSPAVEWLREGDVMVDLYGCGGRERLGRPSCEESDS